MRVMILGGLGFIGSNLVDEFFNHGNDILICDRGSDQSGYNVQRLQMDSVPMRLGPPANGKVGILSGKESDVQDFENLRTRILQFNPDVIINCAADLMGLDRVDSMKSLSEGLDNIIQARREQSVFMGKNSKLIHVHNERGGPGHLFAAAYLKEVQEQDQFGYIVVVSPAELYGPGQGSFVNAYHNKLHRNMGIALPVNEPTDHPMYIRDFSKAVVQLASSRHELDPFEFIRMAGPENGEVNRELARITGYAPDTDYAKGSAILTRELTIYA